MSDGNNPWEGNFRFFNCRDGSLSTPFSITYRIIFASRLGKRRHAYELAAKAYKRSTTKRGGRGDTPEVEG